MSIIIGGAHNHNRIKNDAKYVGANAVFCAGLGAGVQSVVSLARYLKNKSELKKSSVYMSQFKSIQLNSIAKSAGYSALFSAGLCAIQLIYNRLFKK